MKVIIVKNDRTQTFSMEVAGLKLMLASLCCIIFLSLVGGYAFIGLKTGDENWLTHEGVRNWQEVLGEQKQGLATVKQETERQLNALALRLAQLQGRVMRLDALGERLVMSSRLDDGEFDFSEAPALGGPLETLDIDTVYAKPTLIEAIDRLAHQIDSREQQLDLLDSLITRRTRYSDTFVAGIPVEQGWLSSRFGRRTDPFTGKPAWHNGIDFAGKRGTAILSMAAGVVTYAGDRRGYGLLVEVNHGNGYVTRYAHNESIDIQVGDIVERGQVLARMGTTGRSTGYHVHVEVLKNGKQEDPAPYVYRSFSSTE